MSLFRIRRNLAVNGNITIGADAAAGLERKAAGIVGPTNGFTLPNGTIEPGTANLTQNGQVLLGFDSGGNIQMGFRVNGTVVVWSATAGTGTVTSTVAS